MFRFFLKWLPMFDSNRLRLADSVFRSLALYAGSDAFPSLFFFVEAEPLSLNASARLEGRWIDELGKWPNPWGRAEGEEWSGEGVE